MRKRLNEIKLLIFDLDDTLYPEIEYVRSGFKEVSKKIASRTGIGQKKVYSNLLREFQQDKKSVFDRLLRGLNIYSPELLAELINIYRYHKPRIKPYNDVKKTLNILRRRYFLGIVTDGECFRQLTKIEALKLAGYFHKIICTGEGPKDYQKPSPKPFLDMINYFKVKPSEAAYIADNVKKDFYGPNKLGLLSIRIKRNGLYENFKSKDKIYLPQLEIKSLSELKELILNKKYKEHDKQKNIFIPSPYGRI
ncbi:MAG: HAD hydrolase-like protein [Candidatus Aminicenantes bacterium]|nr:HAD hydrolase-like protein [Candidatus Aminicenantes bacterium]